MSKIIKLALVTASLFAFTSCGGSSGGNADYVAMGASDATGFGAVAPFKGYVFTIRDTLDDECESTSLVNLGIPGAKAGTIESDELPVATLIQPELITLWTGPNDIVEGFTPELFESKVQKILADLKKDTHALVFVANVPDMTKLPRFVDDPDPDVTVDRINAFNAAIGRQVAANGFTLVDISTLEFKADFVSDDGFHPSQDGHELIAQKFLEKIKPQYCNNSAT